jgi:hypothetical protein
LNLFEAQAFRLTRVRLLSLVLAATAAGAALSPRPAAAEERMATGALAAAARHVHELRYDEAASDLRRAWHAGGLDPDGLRRLFGLAGEVEVAVGHAAGAQTWFGRLLAVAPDASLPGASQETAAALAAARSELGGRRLRAVAAFAPGALVVTVIEDPMSMAVTLRVSPAGEGRRDVALPGAGRSVRVPIALDRGGRVRVELLDSRGHVLRAWDETAPSPAAFARRGPAPADADSSDRTTRWYRNWRVWGGAGAGCALIGAGLVLVARESADDLNAPNGASPEREFAESLSAERRVERSQAGAVAAFSLAGVSLGAATWLLLRERHQDRASRGSARRGTAALAPLLGGGRYGIAVKIGF